MSIESRPIYLDYNATTPVMPEVVEAMLPYLCERFGNPSSAHTYGREAKAAVEEARESVARLLGCSADEILFTSGGTESNNLTILGTMEAIGSGSILTSVIEHPAVARPCALLEGRGTPVTRLPVDETGVIELGTAREALERLPPALVTVMHANNETGSIQPVRRLAALAKERGAVVHSDAAQSVGKIPVDVDDLRVDLLTIAGHKLYAPKGVGALYVRRGTPLGPVLVGAGHERGLRPGTENVACVVGLGAACDLALSTLHEESRRVQALRDRLWEFLQAGVPDIRLNGHPTERLPNTLNVLFPGIRGSHLLEAADGVAASTGSACHESEESASTVLLAMGIDPVDGLGAVRLSLGRQTTEAEVEQTAEILIAAWQEQRSSLGRP